jgi:hypothetical protein
MKNSSTKEIQVDFLIEVYVSQYFKIPADYQFDESQPLSAYLKLIDDIDEDKSNLTEIIDLEEIDTYTDDVYAVYFKEIIDVGIEECVDIRVVSQS